MNRTTKTILLVVLIALLLCGVAYAAELGIFDIQVQDGASLTPQKADQSPIEAVSGDGITYYPGAERLGLTYNKDIESGKEYLVMVLKGDDATPTEDNIVYIDQLTAEGDSISFNLYPSALENGPLYHVYLSTNASNSEGMTEIGSFRYGTDATQEPLTLNETEITVPAQSTYQLTVTGAENVTWSSNKESVATVDENGLVHALLYGDAVISVTDGETTLTCTVHVLFSDVTDSSKYYFKPVYWAAENNITVGYNSGEYVGMFGVGQNCERRQLMLFLWRYAGSPTKDKDGKAYPDAKTLFNDVGAYGASSGTNKAIAWAYTEGIAKGYKDGGFHPTAPIVRKDVMIMLYRLAGKPAVSGTLTWPDCKDMKPGTDTYNAILWGVQNGITKGYSSGEHAGTFGATLDCLREQIVTFLYRYDGLNIQNDVVDPDVTVESVETDDTIEIVDIIEIEN